MANDRAEAVANGLGGNGLGGRTVDVGRPHPEVGEDLLDHLGLPEVHPEHLRHGEDVLAMRDGGQDFAGHPASEMNFSTTHPMTDR